MPLIRNSAAQELITKTVEVNATDLVGFNGLQALAFEMPVSAVIQGGDITVLVPFNSLTTDVARLGDTTNAVRYTPADINLAAAAGTRVALTPTGYGTVATDGGISLRWTGTGAAPTLGRIRIVIQFIVLTRASFTYGVAN